MNLQQLLEDTEPSKLREWDDESLAGLMADILALPEDPKVEKFFGQVRRRAELVRDEIARRAQESSQKMEFDRWAADMFQRIQAHDDAMRVAKDQLDHQKSSSSKAMWISIAAALAAIGSAILAWLALLRMPPVP